MKQQRVYLSGGMEYADGEGASWRQTMQQWLEQELEHSVFNPNVESDKFFASKYPDVDFRKAKVENIALYQEIVRHLVEIDCNEIAEHSDYVICYWDDGAAKGAGTKGELTIAKYFNKPVYLVTTFQLHNIPGWVLGCTTKFFMGFQELKEFLLAQHK
ncbi:MAG: hypothetical protein HYZ34_12340 [Ignavibacteriae bacterium]|nr:hypothetical protein [Ignavibacteriota bacterium]